MKKNYQIGGSKYENNLDFMQKCISLLKKNVDINKYNCSFKPHKIVVCKVTLNVNDRLILLINNNCDDFLSPHFEK